MNKYFRLVSEELLNRLSQTRHFIKKHNPTIGILTEELLRTFLKTYLPKNISVEQGFIMSKDGILSKQCDIIIYDSISYPPLYRINEIVIVPEDAVLIVIEVKTTINKKIFHDTINYFANISSVCNAKKYLFIYESCNIDTLTQYFHSYKHKGEYQLFDHDTYHSLPNVITGINKSYHLEQGYVCNERDMCGYESFFYEDEQGEAISAFELFYDSVYAEVKNYDTNKYKLSTSNSKNNIPKPRNLQGYFAIELFDM